MMTFNKIGIATLSTQLILTTQLKVLKLARNHLCDDHILHLASWLEFAINLEELDLSGNNCHSVGIEALSNAIINLAMPSQPS
jgi:hypothetical protein